MILLLFTTYIFPDCNVREVWRVGNGICSDELNIYPCNFDGGDCCTHSFISHSYCDICTCYWDQANYPVIITPNTSNLSIYSVFDNYLNMLVYYTGCSIAGDGFCDDSTNDGRCDFDGGDCCLPNINNQYCSFCICYADNPEGKFLSQTILKITQK